MATFLTGSTGYLGSYLAAGLLRNDEPLNVLVRARSLRDSERRLWRAWQLHLGFDEFERHLRERVQVFHGDLTEAEFGLAADARARLVDSTSSVLHCAASLNRRSERACLNVNLRGTLAVLRFARAAHEQRPLRRFSQVSTVAVAGERSHETVTEDGAIDWQRRDYDPYGRTKKLAEELVRQLLPDVPFTIFRPSVVLGDSARPETTQFDMVRAFSALAALPALPFRATDRIDAVPADWVARCIVELHRKDHPEHDTYHLSSGRGSVTYREITDAVAATLDRRTPLFVPVLERPGAAVAAALSRFGPRTVRRGAALLGVFLPYLTYDTVFDNERVVSETGHAPAPLPGWGIALLEWARHHRFEYPYTPWPGETSAAAPAPGTKPAGSLAS